MSYRANDGGADWITPPGMFHFLCGLCAGAFIVMTIWPLGPFANSAPRRQRLPVRLVPTSARSVTEE